MTAEAKKSSVSGSGDGVGLSDGGSSGNSQEQSVTNEFVNTVFQLILKDITEWNLESPVANSNWFQLVLPDAIMVYAKTFTSASSAIWANRCSGSVWNSHTTIRYWKDGITATGGSRTVRQTRTVAVAAATHVDATKHCVSRCEVCIRF